MSTSSEWHRELNPARGGGMDDGSEGPWDPMSLLLSLLVIN